jgi:hypothetical protein
LLERLRCADPPAQLIVCLPRDDRRTALVGPMPIRMPSLKRRAAELARIVGEYACDAAAELHVTPECFTRQDLQWVIARSAGSVAEIEKATMRLLTLKVSTTPQAAADRLGMSRVSLMRWMGYRYIDACAIAGSALKTVEARGGTAP